MIRLLTTGTYKLLKAINIETNLHKTSRKNYLFIKLNKSKKRIFRLEPVLFPKKIAARGNFKLYDVKNEQKLTNIPHLEIFKGDGLWQGYLLPEDLMSDNHKIQRTLIPSDEIITKSFS